MKHPSLFLLKTCPVSFMSLDNAHIRAPIDTLVRYNFGLRLIVIWLSIEDSEKFIPWILAVAWQLVCNKDASLIILTEITRELTIGNTQIYSQVQSGVHHHYIVRIG